MMLFLDTKTKWEETWEYIVENYLSRSPSDFENLGLPPTGTTFALIVFGLFLGFFIGALLSVYHKRVAGLAVRALIEKKATSPETAVAADGEELGPRGLVRHLFFHDLVVKKHVFAIRKTAPVDEKGTPLPNEPLPLTALPKGAALGDYLFFVPEELRIRAEIRFDKKGTGVGGLLFLLVVFFVVACLLVYFLPELFAILNEVAGAFG